VIVQDETLDFLIKNCNRFLECDNCDVIVKIDLNTISIIGCARAQGKGRRIKLWLKY